ncbi:MAG TPA: CDP-alcohol phosphatidyltransferase family protein [Opitutaceae bacterium]|nr:CDP-alcohol phosphatidyltransferase family protein [Opitutaceae bacterium]
MNRKLWPNLLSATRIALMPAVLATAIGGARAAFVGLLVASLTTDALDGFLARRLDAYSELGRKLDSVADYLTMITGLCGIALLWPEIVRRELPWVVSGLAAFFAVVVYGFVRLGRAPCYHTWASKLGAISCALSLIPLLAGKTPLPFHLAIGWMIFAGLEEMTIALLVPWHVGEMATVWHAWRQRQSRTECAGGAPGSRG